MPTSKHRIAVNVEDNEFAELTDMAAKHNVSLAWIGRQALLEFMARYRHQQNQLPLRFTPDNVNVQPQIVPTGEEA